MSWLEHSFAGIAHAAESGAKAPADYFMIGPIAADATFFTLVGLLIFLAIVARMGGFKAMVGILDQRRDKVRAELDEAVKLRAQAQALLEEYQAKRAAAEVEARKLVEQARIDAETLRRTAKAELEADLARRERITQERIGRAEQQAATEAREAAVAAAIETAERLLGQAVSSDIQRSLVDDGVVELNQRFVA